MRTRLPLLIMFLLNLAGWNYFVSGSWGSFFSLEYFLLIHLVISCICVSLLWLLARKSHHIKKLYLLFLSILVSYLPPAITIWLAFAIPQVLALQFDYLSSLLVAATMSAVMGWSFWLPLGLANFFLLNLYAERTQSLRDSTNASSK